MQKTLLQLTIIIAILTILSLFIYDKELIQPSHAQNQPTTNWRNVPITIKTEFGAVGNSNPGEDSNIVWPEVAVFLNNAANYDGPYDYGSCDGNQNNDPAYDNCGTPPLYADRLIDNYTINSQGGVIKETIVKAGDLIRQPYQPANYFISKISYVFHNFFGTPAAYNRLFIYKIEFLAPDGTLLLEYNPTDNSYFGGYGTGSDRRELKESFYFDLGEVTPGVGTTSYVNAFDKNEIETLVENQTDLAQNRWTLDRDGSFNLVTAQLLEQLLKHYPTLTPDPSPTPPTACRTDFNGDGAININDLQVFIDEAQINCDLPSPGIFHCKADLNNNGRIDLSDLQALITDAANPQCNTST